MHCGQCLNLAADSSTHLLCIAEVLFQQQVRHLCPGWLLHQHIHNKFGWARCSQHTVLLLSTAVAVAAHQLCCGLLQTQQHNEPCCCHLALLLLPKGVSVHAGSSYAVCSSHPAATAVAVLQLLLYFGPDSLKTDKRWYCVLCTMSK